ncbi:hypothetical protein LMG6871_00958 [Ralstonia edaphis]|uniref:glycosyltransferase n=1 Tax=Ralstonia edaphi TaxID=3058599 RepID=UPI0028F54F12|nr:glycosyltransferase [Ralstonia sp. LMG 6871]CAJ0713979.1 hypothetical protein LMG6871_00958 [Ralstonia sp. LMG 6871]
MNILTLSTYPFETPLHGGQHRIANIVEILKSAGHNVESAGVLGSDQYPKTAGFCEYPDQTTFLRYVDNPFLMDDFAIGKIFSEDDFFYTKLSSLITTIPDIIFVEQPWLFEFAQRFALDKKLDKAKIIYGSQNVEHRLKRDILNQYLGSKAADIGEQLVLQCELHAIKHADAICCVSEEDLEWTARRTARPCVLAQNGVKTRTTTRAGLIEANRISQHRKFALLCASAHPPNITGFYDIFGAGCGCFAPDELLIIAGSAGPSITADTRFSKVAGMSRSVVSAGVVSEDCIQGLLVLCHAIVLPITHGGGTNLKTAEALWAGRHIVATSTAMRGFDAFANTKGVSIANNSQDFSAAIRAAMQSRPLQLTDLDKQERSTVLWEHTLSSLLELVDSFQAQLSKQLRA